MIKNLLILGLILIIGASVYKAKQEREGDYLLGCTNGVTGIFNMLNVTPDADKLNEFCKESEKAAQ